MTPTDVRCRVSVLAVAVCVVAGLSVSPPPAHAARTAATATSVSAEAVSTKTLSTKTLLNQLVIHAEHTAGYDRAKFGSWRDADHDGCDTRHEVLITEAVRRPTVGSGCSLSGGKWFSRYDGVTTTDPSTFDIDHMVPLAEAWQSGAFGWNAGTRANYANDLGYAADLIAVTAHSNRSKGDREPQTWLPERASYRCQYLANWVAVKWRWHLKVNSSEESFLSNQLRSCGWPSVVKPIRATIGLTSTPTGGGGGGGSGGGLDPRFDYCYEAIAAGYGPYYRGVDPEYYWYTDADHDGIVCE